MIADYNQLEEKVCKTCEILDKHFSKFHTYRGIDKIMFDVEETVVICDDTCGGSYDTESFSFPIFWLSLDEETLIKTAQELVDKEEEEEERKMLEAKERDSKIKEEQERIYYERLKKKFEQPKQQ